MNIKYDDCSIRVYGFWHYFSIPIMLALYLMLYLPSILEIMLA